ncbi:hypothetical protein [Bradyrhizobium sp. Ce-3]|uniref:hypothetical protein n=1 Tax=Bradyrhizobium sp. Ce-3 TaxID=2913970 RepID=UPI001FC8287A|nr:hypothetical protein [Bradyrhizobium sp. Ce-3]
MIDDNGRSRGRLLAARLRPDQSRSARDRLIPDRAFEVVGAGLGLRAIPLRDGWGRREFTIVVRDAAHLSATSRPMLDYLRAAEADGAKPLSAMPVKSRTACPS